MNERQEVVREMMSPNDIFLRITESLQEDRFPGIPTAASVYSIFRAANQYAGNGHYDTYVSTAITSGGVALPKKNGESIAFGEAIKKIPHLLLGLWKLP